MKKHHALLTVAAGAVLWSLGPAAHADELEIAVDTSWIDRGTFNQEFSGNPGFELGYTADLWDYAYVAGWLRNGLTDFGSDEDREFDIGAGLAFPLGDSGLTGDLYAGRWNYGEKLDTGDDVVSFTLSGGPVEGSVIRLSGETDATVYRAAFAVAVSSHLDLVPSVSFVDYDEDEAATNYGLSARYAFDERWQVEATAIWQDGTDDPVFGIRVSSNFDLPW